MNVFFYPSLMKFLEMKYQNFGYTVHSCPRNETEFKESATRLSCGVDENGRNQYICVSNRERSTLVEFCYNRLVGLYEKGHCLEVLDNGYLNQVSCLNFTEGCPEDHFFISDLFKFPACHEINQLDKCFSADPACPNITSAVSNDAESPSSTIVAIIVGLLISVLILIAVLLLVFKKRKGNSTQNTGVLHEMELLISSTERNENDHKSQREIHAESLDDIVFQYLGDYSVWQTRLSDAFQAMSGEEVSVLYCFMCSDVGCPDFNNKNWLDMFNRIRLYCDQETEPNVTLKVTRHKSIEKKNLTSLEACETLLKLKETEFLRLDLDGIHISDDAADETMYCAIERSPVISDYNLFLFSFLTTLKYFRSHGYCRKPNEKCVISPTVVSDSIIIHRLQMNILTHVTMEDTAIFPLVFQILNIPDFVLNQDLDTRTTFLKYLEDENKLVRDTRKADTDVLVNWIPRFWRPDIVRSCIGLHQHMDIYIINNKAYREQSDYHKLSWDIKSFLYCLLLIDSYSFNVCDDSHQTVLKKIRERYSAIEMCNNFDVTRLPQNCVRVEGNIVAFLSDKIRHDVMYAFATECLIVDSDLEFFLTTACSGVLSEYCRSWHYKRTENERCIYIPNRPREMYNYFIEKLQLDIIKHCTVSDKNIHNKINECLKVPKEVLNWDQEAREQYVECAKRGTQRVHHARGMIVGCAEAGKTTFLKRLLRCSKREILNVTPTEGLEVHEEIFEISEDFNSLKTTSLLENWTSRNKIDQHKKTLSFFDFGGQCAYYACHQIYLTRRAFYVVVVDASKNLDEKVNEKVCNQSGTLFSEWTYGDYFVFWIKSVHTYCATEIENTLRQRLIIVATHWDNKYYKSKVQFIEALQRKIPRNSHLLQYVGTHNCFFIQFSLRRNQCCVSKEFILEPLDEIERKIIDIVLEENWVEKIPREWALFDIKIHQRKAEKKILNEMDIQMNIQNTQNSDFLDNTQTQKHKRTMLRYFHDTGKVLYFNEKGLDDSIIIDVQWFVDAFKNIITDKLHLDGIVATRLGRVL